MHRRTWLRVVAACGALGIAACVSPTLPLPPPEAPEIIRPSAAVPGAWEISGNCLAGSVVTVFNEDTGLGVVIEDRLNTGRYRVDLTADECNFAWISQEIGRDTSARTTFVIRERTPAGPVDPTACQ